MEKMIDDLRSIININSVCEKDLSSAYPFGEGVHIALNKALEICKSYGFETKNCENMIGYAEVGSGETLMGILVHLDVVPAGDGWDTDPFSLEIKDGKVYGRGVTDDKGPAIAVIHAIKELLNEGVTFNKRVRIIFGQAEETGAWEDMEYYKKNEEAVDFGFTPDADFPAIYGEKGIAHLKIAFKKSDTCFNNVSGGTAINMVPDSCTASYSVHGETKTLSVTGKAAHGSTPDDGENAISKLMNELSGVVTDCKLIEFFHEFIKLEYNGESLGGQVSDEASGPASYNIGKIETVGDDIVLYIDLRYPVTFNLEDIVNAINSHLSENGFSDVKVEVITNKPHVYMDKNGAVIQTLLSAYRDETGDMSEPTVIGGGTYARAMNGIVAFGPMLPGRELTEHQANEYIYLSDLILAKEIYKTAIKRLVSE